MTIQTQLKSITTTTVFTELTSNSKELINDTIRVGTATTVATMLTARLGMRAATITMDTVNVGLQYALDNTPKTYEETKRSWTNAMDSVMAMFDDEIEAEEAAAPQSASKARSKAARKS